MKLEDIKVEILETLNQASGTDAAVAQLKELGLTTIRAISEELGLEPSRSPNTTFLARRIITALVAGAAKHAEEVEAAAASGLPSAEEIEAAAAAAAATAAAQYDEMLAAEYITGGRKPAEMTVGALRIAYRAVVGRETESHDKAYLIWKIREAKNGKVPVGPVKSPVPATTDQMVIPFRIGRDEAEAMDAGWRAAGFATRMDFLRHAVSQALPGTLPSSWTRGN